MNEELFKKAIKKLKELKNSYGEHAVLQSEARELFSKVGSIEGEKAVSRIAALEASYCEQVREEIQKVIDELLEKSKSKILIKKD